MRTGAFHRNGLVTILVLAVAAAGLGTPALAQIAWQKDVTQALANAKTQKKYVFLLLTNPVR